MSDNSDTMPAAEPVLAEASPEEIALAEISAKLDELFGPAEDGDPIGARACAVLQAQADYAGKLEAELAAANAQLVEATRKSAAPKAAKGEKVAKARKISAEAVKRPREGSIEARNAALLEAIGAAETVEIAFSNGKVELAQLEPVRITGAAWRGTMVGVQLTLPELLIHGPTPGKGGYQIGGYGLFLDGELAAYQERGDQLNVGAGSQQNIAPDIVF